MWPMNCMQVRTNKIFEMLHHPTHGARKFSPNRVLCNMWYHLMHHPTNSFESKTKDGSHWNYHVNVTMCQFIKNHSDDWYKNKKKLTNNAVKMTYGKITTKNTVFPALLIPFDKHKNAHIQPNAKHNTSCHRGNPKFVQVASPIPSTFWLLMYNKGKWEENKNQ